MNVKTNKGGRLKTGRELFLYYHGIGDSLLFSTVLYYLGLQTETRFLVGSAHPEIFAGNPYVKHLRFRSQAFVYRFARALRCLRVVDEFIHMDYYHAGPIPKKHIMQLLAERVGLKEAPTHPVIFLSAEEHARQMLPPAEKPWIAIQSIGNSKWTDNKNWGSENFARLTSMLAPSFSLVQLGSADDPPLPVQLNLCGKIRVRQVFQILGACAGFVGLEGFLMHAATAVKTTAVVIYGGFTAPWQTGYAANVNLYNPVPCAPCWLETKCPHQKKCMEEITPEQVVAAILERFPNGNGISTRPMLDVAAETD